MIRFVSLLLSMCLIAVSATNSQTSSQDTSAAPADLYAHTMNNGVYTNPALGISLTYPDGWEFVDTELLRQQDAESARKYSEANPIFADKGITVINTSNVFVAQQNPSAPVHPQIYLKTQLTYLPWAQPAAYFSENPFFGSKGVQFLGRIESSMKGGRQFAHACIRVKAAKEKPFFACVLSTVIDSPSKDSSRFVVFQFLSPDLEQAQHISAMIDTIQFSAPQAGAFPPASPAAATVAEKLTEKSDSSAATNGAAAGPPVSPDSATGSESSAGDTAASNAPGVRTARLMNIEDVTLFQPPKENYLGAYILTLQDGQTAISVLFHYGLFQHDYTKEIHAGMDIPYRTSGKHVYLKSQDGKEVRTALCESKGDKIRCGIETFKR